MEDPSVSCTRRTVIGLLVGLFLGAGTVSATTIVVRDDARLLAAAEVVVDATVESSQAVLHSNGRVYTHVHLLVHEVWKGKIPGDHATVVEMGGRAPGVLDVVFGTPRYVSGAEVVAFLVRGPGGNWTTLDMWAGLFRVRDTVSGQAIVTRGQADEGLLLVGPRFQPFEDSPRDFSGFRSWILAKGENADTAVNYRLSRRQIREAGGLVAETAEDPPATAQWGIMGSGFRWHAFDSGGSEAWYYGNDPQVGFTAGSTNGNGPLEFARALAAWEEDGASSINLDNAGRHTPPGSGWNAGPDGYSEVLFNDPYNEISGDFNCSGGGVLGFGGVHSTSGSHTFRGRSWYSIAEGDVVMQSWSADCSWLDSEDLTEILEHELGHALGFDHSYDSGETHNQLTDDALMRYFAHGGSLADTLGEDDRCAAYWLYPAARVDTQVSPYSSVTVSPPTVSPGGTATVTVQLDTAGGPLSSGWTLRGWLETTSGSATGTLNRGNAYPDAAFEDDGDGSYTAVITTGAGSGQLTVHVKVDCCDTAVPAPPYACDTFSPTATLTVASGPLPGDANGDLLVNGADAALTVTEIFDQDGTATSNRCADGPCPAPEVDGNDDGTIDAADLGVVLKNAG